MVNKLIFEQLYIICGKLSNVALYQIQVEFNFMSQLCVRVPGPLKSFISVRCNIYISRLCYDVSVRLSVRL